MTQFTGLCPVSLHTLGTVVSFQCSEVNTVVPNHSIYAHCISNGRNIQRDAKIPFGDLVQSIPDGCVSSYMCVFAYKPCLLMPVVTEWGVAVYGNYSKPYSIYVCVAPLPLWLLCIPALSMHEVCECVWRWLSSVSSMYIQCTYLYLWHYMYSTPFVLLHTVHVYTHAHIRMHISTMYVHMYMYMHNYSYLYYSKWWIQNINMKRTHWTTIPLCYSTQILKYKPTACYWFWCLVLYCETFRLLQLLALMQVQWKHMHTQPLLPLSQ